MAIPTSFSPKFDATSSQVDALPSITKLQSYAKADTAKSLFQIFNAAVPFGLMWFAMYKSLSLPYWVTLLFGRADRAFDGPTFSSSNTTLATDRFNSRKWNDVVGFGSGSSP